MDTLFVCTCMGRYVGDDYVLHARRGHGWRRNERAHTCAERIGTIGVMVAHYHMEVFMLCNQIG